MRALQPPPAGEPPHPEQPPGTDLEVRLARPSDNAMLCSLFDRVAMPGTPSVSLRRRPDFFALPELAGRPAGPLKAWHETYVACDPGQDGRVVAAGTHTVRPAWVGGRLQNVGHVSDLRVEPAYRGRSLVRRMAEQGLASAQRRHGIRLATMAALRSNAPAAAAARRGRGALATRTIGAYDMLNVPTRPGNLPHGVRPARQDDLDGIAALLAASQRGHLFGWDLGRRQLEWRLETWPGLRLEDFVVVEQGGRLRGCAAPWSPRPVRQTVIERWGWLRPYRDAQNAMLRVRSRRQDAGAFRSLPPRGGELLVDYLTHVALADADDAVAVLARLAVAAAARRQAHFVAVRALPAESAALRRALRGHAVRRVPVDVLAVSPDGAFPSLPRQPVGIEMALA